MGQANRSADEVRLELYDITRTNGPFREKAERALELGETYLGVDNGHLTRIQPKADLWKAIVSTDSADGRFPPGLVLELQPTYCRRAIDRDSPIALHDAPNQG